MFYSDLQVFCEHSYDKYMITYRWHEYQFNI